MFDDFLNHRCNIYHLVENETTPGYGIKAEPSYDQPAEPDLEDVSCHFHIAVNDMLQITQKEPFAVLDGEIKLSLPPDTDIRKNDIVESLQSGMKYRAGLPKIVYGNHHIIVMLTGEDGIKGAI